MSISTLGTLFQFIGGLFLYGMESMADGLQKFAGNRLQRVLEILTSNRLLGVLVGAGVTAIIQSSSATTVMVVGFVNAGIINLLQATGIIMGASLEAIFMGISAVGGSVPSDCLSGSIIAVAYAIVVGGDGAMETGLALSLTIGTVMSTISTMLMPLWAGLAPYWERLASECKPNKFRAISMVVNFIACLPGAAIIFLGVAFGIEGLQAGLAACPAWVMTGLAVAGTMMTAVGFGILLSVIWSTDIAVFYFVGFICAKSLGLSSLGIAIIGAAIALTLFFIDKRIIDAKNAVAAAPAAGAAAPANSEEDFF